MVNLQNKKKVSQPGVNKHYFYPNFVYKGLTPPPTMGCHPMLTENGNFVTNALRGDLSKGNVRP